MYSDTTAESATASLKLLEKSGDRVYLTIAANDGYTDRTDVMSPVEAMAVIITMQGIAPLKGWEWVRYTVYRSEDALGLL